MQCAEHSTQWAPEDILDLLPEFKDPTLKGHVLREATVKMVTLRPAQAFEIVATTSNVTDSSKLTVAGDITQRLAQTDPATALQHFDAFGQKQGYSQSPVFETERLRVYSAIFTRWARTAPAAAKAHLNSITDPKIQEAAQAALTKGQAS